MNLSPEFSEFWQYFEEAMFNEGRFTVRKLLEFKQKGVNIDQAYRDDNHNALQHACEFWKNDIVKILLQAGADSNLLLFYYDKHYSPLDSAIIGRGSDWRSERREWEDMKEQCIQLLLEFGAKLEISQFVKDEYLQFNTDPRFAVPSSALVELLTETVRVRNDDKHHIS